MKGISSGLSYLHSQKIIHRDLKRDSILIHENVPKICYLGFGKLLHNKDLHLNKTIGPPYYDSPEIVSKQEYTLKSDIWSLGVIFY